MLLNYVIGMLHLARPMMRQKLKFWMLKMRRVSVKAFCGMSVIAWAVNLQGCAMPVPRPQIEPARPPIALTQPIPSESYSISARRDLLKWREMLTGM